MEIRTIIGSRPTFTREVYEGDYLSIAEFFYDTIQGEGVNLGAPASFLRLQGCTQNCIWCDTREVWRYGNRYLFEEIFELIDKTDLVAKLRKGQHLILTGGSPLNQQRELVAFIQEFIKVYGFKPYIEIENECVIMPSPAMISLVDCWNNSPKLSNSLNPRELRYRPAVLRRLAGLENSWFKFVVTSSGDIEELQKDFEAPGIFDPRQIILMPEGATRGELESNREYVAFLAVMYGYRYTTREHVVLWDKKTGV